MSTFALPGRKTTNGAVILALTALLLLSLLFSLTVGAVSIPVRDVVVIFLHQVGLLTSVAVDSTHEVVLSTIRFPRIVMTLLVGASLGVSGASLQGLFRNPLVEPSLIGVSGGAASAVVIAIVFGGPLAGTIGWLYQSVIPLVAFGGGLAATFAVLALTGAAIGLSIFYANESQLHTFTFWTLGALGGATWTKLMIGAPLLILSCSVLMFYPRALNTLALGEAEAFHMGVDVERVKHQIIFFSALAVGVSVSLAGMIGFVGLVVPHVVRVLFHADHKLVLPASVLGGALLLILSDVIARTIVSPAELPIGVVTALIGAPFFIMLLLNAKRKQEI
jgi:iron complex transport system permease protein